MSRNTGERSRQVRAECDLVMQLLDEHDKPMRLRDLSPLVRDNQDGLFNQKQLDVAISERLRMLHADGLVRSCGRHTGWTVVRPGAKEEPAPTASSTEEIRERILEGLRRGPKTRVDLLASMPGVSIDWFRQVFDELVERGDIKRLEQGGQFRYAIMPRTNGVEVDVDKRAEAVFECLARSDTPLKVTELYGHCTRDGSTMYEHYKQALDRLEAHGMVTIRNGTVYVADEVPGTTGTAAQEEVKRMQLDDAPPAPPAPAKLSVEDVAKDICSQLVRLGPTGEAALFASMAEGVAWGTFQQALALLEQRGAVTSDGGSFFRLPIHDPPPVTAPSVREEATTILMRVMMNENLSDRGVLDLRRVVRVLSGQE